MKYYKTYENPKIHEVTGETIRPGGFALTKRAIEYCGFEKGAKLLDVGCGMGATVEYLVDEYKFDAMGIDASPILLKKKNPLRPDLLLIEGKGESLPMESDKLDGVICECSFSLLEDQKKALNEFYRVLKDKGTLIITDMYVRNPSALKSLHNRGIKSCITGAKSQLEYIKMLADSGFDLMLWEDHTKYLAELTAKLILSDLSIEEFFCSCVKADIKAAKLGYFILIAKKNK
jgi:arsenite methyltransferase